MYPARHRLRLRERPSASASRIRSCTVVEEVADAALRQTHEAQEDHRRVLPREVAVQVAVAPRDEALDELDAPRPDHRFERLDDLRREQRREELAVLGVLRRIELLGDHPAHGVRFGGIDELRSLVDVQHRTAREELRGAQRFVDVVVPHERPHVPVGGASVATNARDSSRNRSQVVHGAATSRDRRRRSMRRGRATGARRPCVIGSPSDAILAQCAKVRNGGQTGAVATRRVEVPEQVERLVEPRREVGRIALAERACVHVPDHRRERRREHPDLLVVAGPEREAPAHDLFELGAQGRSSRGSPTG